VLQLRPYQLNSVEGLRNGFRAKHIRQILASPTGSGKSVTALHLIQQAIAKNSRIMFICHRRILVEQFSKHLDAHGIDHGIYMADHWRYKPNALVQVASVQTLEKMDGWPATDLVIVDEIDSVMRKSLKAMLDARPNIRVIGLTATPFHPDIPKYFTSVTSVITMRELVDDGFLVPFRVFSATEIDTKGVKVSMGEWQHDELEKRGLKIVGDVVADYIRLYTKVWGHPKKTICFSSGVAHGAELVQQFAENGLNFVQISYLDDNEYKAEVLKEFAKPDTAIQGVISTDILTRGYDQTDVEHIIIAKPLRKSFSMHVQMVGRVARAHEGKNFAVIQDHSGNWLRFLDSWRDLYGNGVQSLDSDVDSKTRKEPSDEEKKKSCCPQGGTWIKII